MNFVKNTLRLMNLHNEDFEDLTAKINSEYAKVLDEMENET